MKIDELKKFNLHNGSHKFVSVECDYNLSEKCKYKYRSQYRKALEWAQNNDDRVICLYCSRSLKSTGRSNSNTRYKTLDDNFFNEINTEFKAYMLGWIASDGHIAKNGSITIQIHKKDELILSILRNNFCKELVIKQYKKKKQVALTINSLQINKSICKYLCVKPGKKDCIVQFPKLNNEFLTWAFIRGYFDGDGTILKLDQKKSCKKAPRCSITSNSKNMLREIADFSNIRCSLMKKSIEYSYNNALDFLSKLYDNSNYRLNRKYELYLKWSYWVPSLSGSGNFGQELLFRWNRSCVNAIPPFKCRASDVGYDLTIIDTYKQLGDIVFYDTGIKVQPEYGWYFDLVPRSSLAKTGYMLANSVGIIDRSYTGTIRVPLIKIDKTKPDIKLPCRVVQLIPRPIVHINLVEVDTLDDTERSTKGFGSSGK